jgi:ATP-dependent Clp protease protease subunit
MKVNKLVVALAVLFAVVAYPVVTLSKSNSKDTIVLTADNTVNLSGEITSESVAETIAQLRQLDSKTHAFGKQKPIYLFMYTPGGEVESGLQLIEAAQGLKRPVDTLTLFSASMGFQAVQALGKRLVLKNGTLMSHRAAGEFSGYFGGKSPSQLDSRYNFWLQRINELDQQTVARTNGKQTMASYREQYQNETWLTGTQSVDQGYADEVVKVRCDDSLNGTVGHEINFMGMPIHYETSKCPLITAIMNISIGGPPGAHAVIGNANLEDIKAKFIQSRTYDTSSVR